MASLGRIVAAGARRRLNPSASMLRWAFGSISAAPTDASAMLFSYRGMLKQETQAPVLRFHSSSAVLDGDEGSDFLASVDTSSLMAEEDFHNVANATLQHLQEKIEAFGEQIACEGFDTDYAEGVLTVRFGDLGTYVINKQTPNRQIWLSSPVSGPARFDWVDSKWIYRRAKTELYDLLQKEFEKLHGRPINLSQ